MARNITEELGIRLVTLGGAKAAKDIDRVGKSIDKVAKRSGAASSAIINLGRGVSDARFGFHGLANNLEFMVEMFGLVAVNAKKTGQSVKSQLLGSLIGPAGLVAAITILIAYGPEIYKFFKEMMEKPALDVADAIEKVNKKIDEMNVDEYLTALQAQNRANLKITQDRIKEIDKFEKQGGQLWKNQKERLIEERKQLKITEQEQISFDNQLIDGMQNRAKALQELVKKKYDEIAARKKNKEAVKEEYSNSFLTADENTGSLFSQLSLNPQDFEQWRNNRPQGEGINIGGPGLYTHGWISSLVTDVETAEDVMARFSGSVAQSLGQAAGAGENFAANFGASILTAIGNFLVAEGVAAIASGTTKVASGFLSAIGLGQIKAGYAEVGIGAALKAGGAAISGLGSKGSSGGGPSGGSGTYLGQGAPNPTLSSNQGTGGSGRQVGILRGQDMYLQQERALRVRQTF